MALPIPLVVAVILVLFVGAGVALFQWRRHQAAGIAGSKAAYPALRQISRRTLGLRYAGVVLGLMTIPICSASGRFGLGLILTPVIIGCVIEISLIVGELWCFRSARETGQAGLERRTMTRYLPRPLMILFGIVGVCFAGLTVWSWKLAAPDGRSFTVSVLVNQQDVCGDSTSPFPGPFYTVGLIVGSIAAVTLAGVAMAVIVQRRRNGADPVLARFDDELRNRNARAVVATLVGAMSANLAIVAFGMSLATGAAASYAPGNLSLRQCLGNVGATTAVVVPDISAFATPLANVALVGCGLASLLAAVVAFAVVLTDTVSDHPAVDPARS